MDASVQSYQQQYPWRFFLMSLLVFLFGCLAFQVRNQFSQVANSVSTKQTSASAEAVDKLRQQAIAQAKANHQSEYSFTYTGALPPPLSQ